MNLQLADRTVRKERESKLAFLLFNAAIDCGRIELICENDKPEVLEFLKIRPVHTVVMTSLIQDNGIENSENRGRFYGFRNSRGKLEGVALIGHTTLVEARTEAALKAFAAAARKSETPIHLMMSDGTAIERFWTYYADFGQKPRLVCDELLFELSFPFFVRECEWNVRLAEETELEKVAEAHAEVAFIESGICPMEKDRAGFLRRCLKRIENKRTFVVFDEDKLVFKADIVAETDDVVYLEGVYVSPEYRGKNVASACLAQLSASLLERASHICLLSNSEFKAAHRSFLKAGFSSSDSQKTIFV